MDRELLINFLNIYQSIGMPCKEDIQFMMQQITANWPIQDEWREQQKIECKKTEHSLSKTQIACLQICIDCIWREEWLVFICELINFISNNESILKKEILEIERQTIHMLRGMVFQNKNFLETIGLE